MSSGKYSKAISVSDSVKTKVIVTDSFRVLALFIKLPLPEYTLFPRNYNICPLSIATVRLVLAVLKKQRLASHPNRQPYSKSGQSSIRTWTVLEI